MQQPKDLLSSRALFPKKSFGQNFLHDRMVLRDIADACVPNRNASPNSPNSNTDTKAAVLELGAGTGALTEELLSRFSHVCAVERDRDLLPILQNQFSTALHSGQLTLIEGDAKKVSFEEVVNTKEPNTKWVLAGNLPYQLTGFLLERACAHSALFHHAVFMIQKEVALRAEAPPDTENYGALSVFLQASFRISILRDVSPSSFYPAPKVTSSVLSLVPHEVPLALETPLFRDLVHAAFAMRRKTLRNTWKGLFPSLSLLEKCAEEAGISLEKRGETLSVEDFARMEKSLRAVRAISDVL